MRSWTVLHMPTHSLVTIVAKSRDRVLEICRHLGWQSDDLLIRVK